MNPQLAAGITALQVTTGVGVATQLTATPSGNNRGQRVSGKLTLTALSTNSAPVFVGGSNAVTASGATGGLQLAAGASVDIFCDDPSRVWLFSAAAQVVSALWT